MLRSSWRIGITLAGLTILFAFLGLGAMLMDSHPKEQRYERYRYASDKPSEIDPALSGQADPKALKYREPCREPKGKDESDLCAQWRAAYAGEDSAFWTKWSVIVGLAGVIGLIVSLYYTRRAVQIAANATEDSDIAISIARENADAAKASAIVAERTLALSQEVAARQLRPYVAVSENLIMLTAEGSVSARVETVNYGTTPAFNVIHEHQVVLTESGKEDFWKLPPVKHMPVPGVATYPPNAKFYNTAKTPILSDSTLSDVQSGKVTVIIRGFIEYTDVSGRTYRTDYSFYSNKESAERGVGYMVSPVGNHLS